MPGPELSRTRVAAWSAVRQAVRAYAADPCDRHARNVEAAVIALRRLRQRSRTMAASRVATEGARVLGKEPVSGASN